MLSAGRRIGALRPVITGIATLAAAAALALPAVWNLASEEEVPDGRAADLRNGRVFIQDNLWTTSTHQFAVWVDNDQPYVAKRRLGSNEWQVTNLGLVQGNPLAAPTASDDHNVYAIGVDSRGYVHVAGNMHGDPLRYVRSAGPERIDKWTRSSIGGPSAHVTYPRFVGLADGTLLFFRRAGQPTAGEIVLDVLPPGEAEWRYVGPILADDSGGSAYLHHVAVDRDRGDIHLLFEWRQTSDPRTTNDIGYARSDDGGYTWQDSAGREIDLPISHTTAEIALDTADEASGLVNDGGLALDDDGRPHGAVLFEGQGGQKTVHHLWHDGRQWRDEVLDAARFDARPALVAAPSGLWIIGSRGNSLEAVPVRTRKQAGPHTIARVPQGWEPAFDTQALDDHGSLQLLIPDGRTPMVVEVDLGNED